MICLPEQEVFLKEVVQPQLDAGKDVIIVGHGAMDSSIVCQVQNIPLEKFWDAGIENCKLMKLLLRLIAKKFKQ